MGAESLKKAESLVPDGRTSEVPITRKQATVPAEWLERLLVTSCELDPDAPLDAAVETLLTEAAGCLEDTAIGACIPDGDGQIVVRRSSREGPAESPDPTRLFPEFSHERVFEIPGDEASTLHLASDTQDDGEASARVHAFVGKVAMTLGATIRRTRARAVAKRHRDALDGLEQQIIQSEKLASLGQIAAGIVHELNNPLTSIVAYSDYLRRRWERDGVDPSDRERLQRINEAAERILLFSRDLIAYSRPATEVPAPVLIHEVIDRALGFCEHVIDVSSVNVDRDYGEVRPIRGVAGQLTQVFVNLFTNACHAMQAAGGGRLFVGTELPPEGDRVHVIIRDEGHGIDEEHTEKIFEPFFTTKTDGTGTGLGLSIVRKIITSHGGRIRAYPNAPRGTVFVVELPIAAS